MLISLRILIHIHMHTHSHINITYRFGVYGQYVIYI